MFRLYFNLEWGAGPTFFLTAAACRGWFSSESQVAPRPMVDRERLTALIEPVVEREGAELVDLEVAGSLGRPIVRAYVDTEAGVTLDECARLSRRLEQMLESTGAVPERYVLEVSSPGIERPLTKRAHFEHYLGREIAVRLHRKHDGRKRFVGTLEEVEGGAAGSYAIKIAGSEGRWTFDAAEIARARLQVQW
jgi:ribosome maturation factor RimP